MIKLSGSRFTDIMPENLASQVETKAFAYAVGRQIENCAPTPTRPEPTRP